MLGIAITRDRAERTIALSQQLYIETVCNRFSSYLSASTARNFDVPAMADLSNFSQADCPEKDSIEWFEMQALGAVYFSMIGALIWLTSCTRCDVCVATAVLARFSINPAKVHFAALIRVFLYLQKDKSRVHVLGGKGPDAERLSIFTDASHEEGPSLSGVLIVMGTAAIDWICRRQKSTVRNSTAAEAMANADGCDDGIYKRELAKEFGVAIDTTMFYTDNESCVRLHENFFSCKKSKHILRAIKVLRQCVMTCIYTICHIMGVFNFADMLTKPLSGAVFYAFRNAVLGAKIVLPPGARSGGGVSQARI